MFTTLQHLTTVLQYKPKRLCSAIRVNALVFPKCGSEAQSLYQNRLLRTQISD